MALFSKRNLKYNPFGLTEDDLKGDLSERAIPMGIIVRMLEEQERQGNNVDIKVFQAQYNTIKYFGGFAFAESREGKAFWVEVLNERHYDLFFKKYPDYARYNLA